MEQTGTSIEVSLRNELTLTSPELIQGAKAMRYRPQVLLERIQQYLPSPVEARLYLAIGTKLRHRPKTFSIILRELLGRDEVREEDFRALEAAGPAKVDKLLEDLETACTVMLRIPYDYNGLRIGAQTVARLVICFGSDVDAFIASVMDNIPEVGKVLGYSGRAPYRSGLGDDDYEWYPEGQIAKHAFGFWGNQVFPQMVAGGIPYHTEFLRVFEYGLFDEADEEDVISYLEYVQDEEGGSHEHIQ